MSERMHGLGKKVRFAALAVSSVRVQMEADILEKRADLGVRNRRFQARLLPNLSHLRGNVLLVFFVSLKRGVDLRRVSLKGTTAVLLL